MKFYSRRVVKPNDLNPAHRLFGGQLLSWIDEEAAIYAACQMQHPHIVTKFISEVNFVHGARTGDILEFGFEVSSAGRSSLTLHCEVRNKVTLERIIWIDRIVFVSLDTTGRPVAHRYCRAA
ncbi:MAG: hotdog domain-containing protein [Pseudomonadota bacterium]